MLIKPRTRHTHPVPARDLLGAIGIVDDYRAMRHMVNRETVRTYEGTHDVHTLVLGEHITGERAI